MSNRRFVIAAGGILLLLVIAIGIIQREPIDWTPTYSLYDHNPIGGSVLFSLLPNLFESTDIQTLSGSEETFLAEDTPSGNIVIIERFDPGAETEKDMLLFAEYGGYAFIAASDFSASFLKELNLKISRKPRSTYQNMFIWKDQQVMESRVFSPSATFQTWFEIDSDSTIKALTVNGLTGVVFIFVPYYDGGFFIWTEPEVFSNIALLNESEPVVSKIFSYLPEGFITWDERIKGGKYAIQTGGDLLLKQPAIYFAFLTTLVVSLVFISTNFRRLQRAVPIYSEPQNTTLAFINVVASLYRSTGNPRQIANKRIRYFNHFIINRYRLSLTDNPAEIIQVLNEKSGVRLETITNLVSSIQILNSPAEINDQWLLKINNQLETFYSELHKTGKIK